MTADARSAALIAVIAVAPLAIVLIVAMLRSYTIHIEFDRKQPPRRKDEE